MLKKWQVAVITGLFAFGALSFFLGLFPMLAEIFWILWLSGCGACILALVLAVVLPSNRSGADRTEANRSAASPREVNRPEVNRGDGVSQP